MASRRRATTLASPSAQRTDALRRLGNACVAACRSIKFSLAPAMSVTSRAIPGQSGASADQTRSTSSFQVLSC